MPDPPQYAILKGVLFHPYIIKTTHDHLRETSVLRPFRWKIMRPMTPFYENDLIKYFAQISNFH